MGETTFEADATEIADGLLFPKGPVHAVDAAGWVCVATLIDGAITAIAPDGSAVERYPMPDIMTTNIAFGGTDLTTAYVTLSSTGKLVKLTWPRAGLRLHHYAQPA